MASSILLQIVLAFSLVAVINAEDKIVQTHILFRHGDRSPIGTYETNPYNESAWPQGYEQLSSIGMEQEYELGQFLRKRYIEGKLYMLLNKSYVRTEVMVRSSDTDRTLMSAYANLAGLYPPLETQVWNQNISWQPIPVHTVPKTEDNLLHMDSPCPAYDKVFQEVLKSDEVVQLDKRYKEFFEFVKLKTGKSYPLNISNIWEIHDVLFCESKHNMTVPVWASEEFYNETVFEILQDMNNIQFDLHYNRKNEAMLRGGSLLKKVITDINNTIMGNDDGVKAYLYSAHDGTIAALLSAMGLFNKKSPPYAACAMIELHLVTSGDTNKKVNQEYYITVLYRNSSYNEPVPMQIPGCDVNCPLEKFLELTEKNVLDDWKIECQARQEAPSADVRLILLVVMVVLISTLVIAICVIVTRPRKCFQSVDYFRL